MGSVYMDVSYRAQTLLNLRERGRTLLSIHWINCMCIFFILAMKSLTMVAWGTSGRNSSFHTSFSQISWVLRITHLLSAERDQWFDFIWETSTNWWNSGYFDFTHHYLLLLIIGDLHYFCYNKKRTIIMYFHLIINMM